MFVFDGMNTTMMPPYGNTMIETPNLNQLAAQSVVCDFSFTDSPDLKTAMRSVWHGGHAANKKTRSNHLAALVANAGIQTILFTDDSALAESPLSEDFDRVIKFEFPTPSKLARERGETWLAGFFAQTLDCLEQLEPGSLLWIHCTGLWGPWDAPYPIRVQIADEEDPDPPESVEPPRGWFDKNTDSPDVLLGYQQCCAAQLVLFDEFLGVLLDPISQRKNMLFSLLSTRGFPLGEHGHIGNPENLYSETIHVPLMIRWPQHGNCFRTQNLVQPCALYEVLRHWFAVENSQVAAFLTQVLPDQKSEAVVSRLGQNEAIHTHGWKLIRSIGTSGEREIYLFKKPDDRWDVNDVYDRCPGIASELESLLDECLQQLGEDKIVELSLGVELTS